jgi:putative ABC transport system permease protein
VGLEDRGSLAAPLRLVSGSLDELRNQDAVIIDESERKKLGNPELGDTVEIMNHRARIVGFTRGMRSFTTTPFIFTSLRRSHRYGWLTEKGRLALYYLVKVKPGFDIDTVRRAIQANIEGVEVHTREAFSQRTRMYWLFETGVGFGFLAASVLGLLVGGVTTSQTLYTMTLDKLPEFAVLKALGTTMFELSSVVLTQSLICGGVGLAVGLGVSFALAPLAELAGTTVLIPWPLVVGVAVLTVCLCSGASVFSILRLRRVDPAMVVRL